MQRRFALVTTALVGACASPADEALRQEELVVFAASSLREAFEDIAQSFGKGEGAPRVVFNFAGSQELRTQIESGAQADVFASADEVHMEALRKTGSVEAPRAFARNEVVLVVHKSSTSTSTSTIRRLEELPNVDRIVIGAPEVPIGRYTARILDRASAVLGTDFRARVEAKVVSRELNVRQVLAKVRLGEADAGFVYRTDALVATEVETISIPPELNVVATYPIAVLEGAAEPKLARDFADYVLSETGQQRLRRAGFLAVRTAGTGP